MNERKVEGLFFAPTKDSESDDGRAVVLLPVPNDAWPHS
jgi:hypothetical protein